MFTTLARCPLIIVVLAGTAHSHFAYAQQPVQLASVDHSIDIGYELGHMASLETESHHAWDDSVVDDFDAATTHSCDSCGDSCCDGCHHRAGCCGCCCKGSLGPFGLIGPSDACFSNFITPVTNTLFFEDPRTLTELRPIYIYHNIPNGTPIGGGSVQGWAAQFRIALTERLSIIATKDGYIHLNNDALGEHDGWADLAAGLKYNLFRDVCNQQLLSTGFVYEIDMGEHQVLQGRGDGEFHFFLSGGSQIGDYGHWVSGTGFRIPTDHTARSQMWYWSNHWDYALTDSLYSLVELNWYHWMRSGEALPFNFEGGDVFNLGSTDVAGNDIVTAAVGGRYKATDGVIFGCAWEFPLTNRRDLLHDRLTVDMILRY